MEDPTQPEETQVEQTSSLHQVTPLSKYLALALFILLPFIGAWIGYQYAFEKVDEIKKTAAENCEILLSDKLLPSEKIVEVEKLVEKKVYVYMDTDQNTWSHYENKELGFSFSYPSEWGEVELGEVHYGSEGKFGPRQVLEFSACGDCQWNTRVMPRIAVNSADFGGIGTGMPIPTESGYRELSEGKYEVEVGKGGSFVVSNDGSLELSVVNNALFYRGLDQLHGLETTRVIFNLNDDIYSGLSFIVHDQVGETKNSELLKTIVETVVIE